MADPVRLTAGWAIWSKHPGTREDYSVLAASAKPLSMAEFTQVLMHFAAGNPPAEEGAASSLPWVMLSRVGVADQPYLGVSVQVPAGAVDGVGRPVSHTSYICVPYHEIAQAGLSYQALADALSSTQLPGQAGPPVELTVPPPDPEELARTVAEFGLDVVAAVAARLLAGPVTITGPDLPDTPTRLRFLDAVASLLPFGYRADYTAATWSDTGASGQRFRLVFASRARDEMSRVAWRAPAQVPGQGPAGAYLNYLQRASVPLGAASTELAALIAFLIGETQPRKFDRPDHAIDSVAEFFRAAVVGEAIDAGTARLPEIRLVFARGQDQQLSPDRRRRCLERLIEVGESQDWPVIRDRFGLVAEGYPHVVPPPVTLACRGLLWSPAAKDLVPGYLRLVEAYGLADTLLAELIVPPGSAAELESGLDTATALLADFALSDPAAYPRTQQALASNVAAGTALLAYLSGAAPGDARLGAAVEWLEPVLDRVLPKFNAVLGRGRAGVPVEHVDTAALVELSQEAGPLAIRHLLRAASGRRRLHLVLPGLVPWLTWEAVRGTSTADQQYWSDVAMELTPATAAEAAWLDLALLATGNDPRSLLASRFQSELSQELAGAWLRVTGILQDRFERGQAADDRLTGALIEFLGRQPWRHHPDLTAIVHDLIAPLTADGRRPELRAAVLDPLAALAQLPSGTEPAQVARLCARAYAYGLAAGLAADTLAESGAITSGLQAADVVADLHRALAGDRTEPAMRWQATLAGRFADGVFGEQIAAEFAALAMRNASDELVGQLCVLDAVARAGGRQDAPRLTDADAHVLDGARSFLQRLLRDARPPQSRLIARGIQTLTGGTARDGHA